MTSSSDSDDDLFLIESSYLKMRTKRIGVHPINASRKQYGEYHHLFQELRKDEERFFQYMRMTQSTFNYILQKTEENLTKTWTNWHKQPILPEERLVVTLRYLATGSSFKSLAFSFRMGASTVGNIIAETVVIIWEQLQPVHMPVPTEDYFRGVAEEYSSIWNFPNVLGAIDGKHVRVQCPGNSGSMYYNYKKYFSVVLQGVADAQYKFTVIDVGGYGKQSDGGTFIASDLYAWLKEQKLKLPQPQALPNTTVKVPFVFLGDDAYPLLNCLIKPYKGNNLSFEEECFNQRLSRARKTVECAFGMLYSKWRILAKSIETDVSLVNAIIKSVCILQNTIIDREGFERHLTEVSVQIQPQTMRPNVGRPPTSSVAIRDIFKTYICNNPITYHE